MFSLHQGTMDEIGRQFMGFDVGEGSAAQDARLRAQEANVERTAAHHHHLFLHHHHPTTTTTTTTTMKRELPQRQRVQQPESATANGMSPTRGSKSTAARRGRRTTINVNRNETPAERHARLTYMRERRKQRLESETEEQKSARLVDCRERARQKLMSESHEERERRLEYLRDHQRQRIKSETKEEREKRLLYLRERQKERIRNETPEQRERRLNRSRKHHRKPPTTPTSPSEPELNVDISEDVLYVRDARCQVILTEPHPQSARDPLDLRDYQNREPPPASLREEGGKMTTTTTTTVDKKKLTIGRVWSLKPNTGVDDKLWYHNQL